MRTSFGNLNPFFNYYSVGDRCDCDAMVLQLSAEADQCLWAAVVVVVVVLVVVVGIMTPSRSESLCRFRMSSTTTTTMATSNVAGSNIVLASKSRVNMCVCVVYLLCYANIRRMFAPNPIEPDTNGNNGDNEHQKCLFVCKINYIPPRPPRPYFLARPQ